MIKLNTREIDDGNRTIIISEADWDFTSRFTSIDSKIEELIKDEHDETFKFFCRNYYPLMAACVFENTPTAKEAYEMSRKRLDDWYIAVWELNPDIIDRPFKSKFEFEDVSFRDGSTVRVYATYGLPSFALKLNELEVYAQKNIIKDDPQGQLFQLIFYPKLAAACNGSVIPNANDVRRWPRSEITKWMVASQKMNPDWYTTPESVDADKDKKEKKAEKS